MQIKTYQKEYADSVKNLVSSIMLQEYPDEQRAYQYNDLDAIDKAYGNIRENFFIALENDSVIGSVGVKEDSDTTALLRRLFVHRSHRGRGVGSMLVDMALDFCKMNQYNFVNFRATANMKAAVDLLSKKKGFDLKDRYNLEGIEILNLVYKIK